MKTNINMVSIVKKCFTMRSVMKITSHKKFAERRLRKFLISLQKSNKSFIDKMLQPFSLIILCFIAFTLSSCASGSGGSKNNKNLNNNGPPGDGNDPFESATQLTLTDGKFNANRFPRYIWR